MTLTREQEDAWLAALLDGEGHFNLQRRASYTHISIRIVQCLCDELLEKIKGVTGFGTVDPGFQWRIDNREGVQAFLDRTEPYLIVKKEEASLVRAIVSTFARQGYHPKPEALILREKLMVLWENRPRSRKARKEGKE